ncbi:hypothetical protein BDF14DRAFT_1743679 [Spinellus fusiger]|nr:hypothetical protein BDF14DRAFT_1743679 [Spinellus fusiger]
MTEKVAYNLSRIALAKAIKTPDAGESGEGWNKSVIFHQSHIPNKMRDALQGPQRHSMGPLPKSTAVTPEYRSSTRQEIAGNEERKSMRANKTMSQLIGEYRSVDPSSSAYAVNNGGYPTLAPPATSNPYQGATRDMRHLASDDEDYEDYDDEDDEDDEEEEEEEDIMRETKEMRELRELRETKETKETKEKIREKEEKYELPPIRSSFKTPPPATIVQPNPLPKSALKKTSITPPKVEQKIHLPEPSDDESGDESEEDESEEEESEEESERGRSVRPYSTNADEFNAAPSSTVRPLQRGPSLHQRSRSTGDLNTLLEPGMLSLDPLTIEDPISDWGMTVLDAANKVTLPQEDAVLSSERYNSVYMNPAKERRSTLGDLAVVYHEQLRQQQKMQHSQLQQAQYQQAQLQQAQMQQVQMQQAQYQQAQLQQAQLQQEQYQQAQLQQAQLQQEQYQQAQLQQEQIQQAQYQQVQMQQYQHIMQMQQQHVQQVQAQAREQQLLLQKPFYAGAARNRSSAHLSISGMDLLLQREQDKAELARRPKRINPSHAPVEGMLAKLPEPGLHNISFQNPNVRLGPLRTSSSEHIGHPHPRSEFMAPSLYPKSEFMAPSLYPKSEHMAPSLYPKSEHMLSQQHQRTHTPVSSGYEHTSPGKGHRMKKTDARRRAEILRNEPTVAPRPSVSASTPLHPAPMTGVGGGSGQSFYQLPVQNSTGMVSSKSLGVSSRPLSMMTMGLQNNGPWGHPMS